jgi:aspartate racemase
MRAIGLIGGMTPESTLMYYEQLIHTARAPGANPLHNPVILVFSIDLAELVALQRSGDRAAVADYLGDRFERLRHAGAGVGALTANTPHAYFDEIKDRTSLSLVSIVTATRDAASERGICRPLLLGTGTTLQAPMYPQAFAEAGIEVILPGDEERGFLDRTIYNELAVGRVTPEVHRRCLEICTRHIEADSIDAVILGCTELPLVIRPADLSIPVLDTTVTHVAAILAAAA